MIDGEQLVLVVKNPELCRIYHHCIRGVSVVT